MKALILLGAVLAAPAMAQQPAGTLSPEEASKIVVDICSEHSQSNLPITEANANQIEKKGVKYQREAPDFLASTKSTQLGVAEYVRALSTSGEIWAIGYDSSSCMVVALGVPTAESEKGFRDFFESNKTWREERGASSNDPAVKLERFAANPRRSQKLVATVSIREAANQATITMVREQR